MDPQKVKWWAVFTLKFWAAMILLSSWVIAPISWYLYHKEIIVLKKNIVTLSMQLEQSNDELYEELLQMMMNQKLAANSSSSSKRGISTQNKMLINMGKELVKLNKHLTMLTKQKQNVSPTTNNKAKIEINKQKQQIQQANEKQAYMAKTIQVQQNIIKYQYPYTKKFNLPWQESVAVYNKQFTLSYVDLMDNAIQLQINGQEHIIIPAGQTQPLHLGKQYCLIVLEKLPNKGGDAIINLYCR